MNKIKTICLPAILAAGLTANAFAAAPCDGFEIKIKNNLPDNLLVTQVRLSGAEIQPNGIQQIEGKSEQVFTVNKSAEKGLMSGEFVFHTVSLPSKEVKVQFDLKNETLICKHDDKTPAGDYPVDKTRLPNQVAYTIGK
ncbi:Uncharacterised protein [Legionella beliardensis]|uniref:Uncharacterized protein n=1 Tax=Legionella beliardensis TaxID=91822 RepID=A0A378I4V4_9GAMM|nr:hypothetical protein [Legionella beliardensis]STX29872.1 Uncharacterised protein [Legionella beliardensis]